MKLKKLAAGVLAAVIAVTSTVVAPVTASAATLAAAPTGTETVLAAMEGGSASLASWGCQWIQSYDENLATWIADSDTYMKFTFSAIGDFTGDDGNPVSIDNLMSWDGVEGWFQFFIVNEAKVLPNAGVSAAGGTVYLPMSSFALNEYNGIGFNMQAGHVSCTVASVNIVKVSAAAPTPTPDPEPDEEEIPDAPEGVTPIVGKYDDGKYVQDFNGTATGNTGVVDVDTATTDDTIASLVDGNLYIYTQVAEDDLADASKGVVYIKNVDTEVSLKVTTTKAFTKLYDGAEAADGNVFVAYVISGVTDAADWAWSDIVIE
ncbi:MAG: hypothetical protein IJZ95_01455 [Oscillospiraceae bacterium]|nr:hypothetical protein [Oscillospiraceae bacterium]